MFEKLLDPANFEFFAKYVLSGFVIVLVTNAYVAGQKPQLAEKAFEIVLYSLINQWIWLGLSSLASLAVSNLPANFRPPIIGPQLAFNLQVIALPICLGIFSGLSLQRGWRRNFARVISLPLVDPYAQAYDHVVAQFKGQAFVVIAYENGENIFGLFGYQSRASRDVERSELYLERLYDVDENGKWTPTGPAKSAPVQLKNVRAIEFIPVKEDQNGT